MPNSLQSSAIGSPASRRATNCSLSSITEHSFQGITPSSLEEESVTDVSGTKCYPVTNTLREIVGRSPHSRQLSRESHGQSKPFSLHASKPISSVRMQCRDYRASGTGSAAPNISPEQSAFPSVTPDRRSCLSFCVSTALLFPVELYGMESYLRGGKYNLAGLSSFHRRERYTKVHAWCRLLPAFCLGRGNTHTSGE